MNQQDKLMKFVNNSQGLLNNLRSANFIKSIDSIFIACNVGTENMLKVKAKDLVRRSDYDFHWENHADLYRQHDQDALNDGLSDVLEPVPVSKKITLVLRTVKSPIRDEHQDIIGIFAQMTIISENKNLTEAFSFINSNDKKRVDWSYPDFVDIVTRPFCIDFQTPSVQLNQ